MTTTDLIARLRAGTVTPEICEAAAVALEQIIAAYDYENPFRLADFHAPGCGCLRCAVDNILNLKGTTK
jgi:hypothetical protein